MVGLGAESECAFQLHIHDGLLFSLMKKMWGEQFMLIWSLETQAPSLFMLHHSEHEASMFRVTHGCLTSITQEASRSKEWEQLKTCESPAVNFLKKPSGKSIPITLSNFSLLRTYAHSQSHLVIKEAGKCHLLFRHVSAHLKLDLYFKS